MTARIHRGLVASTTATGERTYAERWTVYVEGECLGHYASESEAQARIAYWQEHGR